MEGEVSGMAGFAAIRMECVWVIAFAACKLWAVRAAGVLCAGAL